MSALVPIADAAAYTVDAQLGDPPSRVTVWRWCVFGVAGVTLRHRRSKGGRLYTSAAWVAEFERHRAEAQAANLRRWEPETLSYAQQHTRAVAGLREMGLEVNP